MTMERGLLTRQKAAEFLGISKSMLDKLVRQRKIPFVKFCRKPLFRIEDLQKFIEEHLQKENNNETR